MSAQFKRWTIFKRTPTTSTSWTILYETESFDMAKQRIIEEYATVGLECLMLCRPVDLYTVMYPIS